MLNLMKQLSLSSNIFFTSDTHFFHNNIIKYCNRPFLNVDEMNARLIENWNDIIKPNDIIFHLGDIALCNYNKLSTLLEQLNGQIYLINGNHDCNFKHFPNKIKEVFDMVTIKIKDDNKQILILSHYPLRTWSQSSTGAWNLCGHIHSSPTNIFELDPLQYDVGVDNNNFTPVSYFQIKEHITNQVSKYVNNS